MSRAVRAGAGLSRSTSPRSSLQAVIVLLLAAAALAFDDVDGAVFADVWPKERAHGRPEDLAHEYARGPLIEAHGGAPGHAHKATFIRGIHARERRVLPAAQTTFSMKVGQPVDSWELELLDGSSYRYDGSGGIARRSVLLLGFHPKSHDMKLLWFSSAEYAPALASVPEDVDVDVVFYAVGEDAADYTAFLRERLYEAAVEALGEERAAALFDDVFHFAGVDPLAAARGREGRDALYRLLASFPSTLELLPVLLAEPHGARSLVELEALGGSGAWLPAWPADDPAWRPRRVVLAVGDGFGCRVNPPTPTAANPTPAPHRTAASPPAASPPAASKRPPPAADRGPSPSPTPSAGPSAGPAVGQAAPEDGDYRGAVVLVRRGRCSFHEKMLEAQRRNASAVLVYSGAEEPKGPMGCGGGACGGVSIPGLMIDHSAGVRMRGVLAAGGRVYVASLRSEPAPPVAIAIDREHRARRLGALRRPVVVNGTFLGTVGPSLAAALLETRSYAYLARLERRKAALASTPGYARVTALEGRPLGPADAPLRLPPNAPFGELAVELQLRCHRRDEHACGEWDRIMTLHVCTGNPSLPGAVCREALRWITSYGREAHWLTDARGVIPLLFAPASQNRALRGNATAAPERWVRLSIDGGWGDNRATLVLHLAPSPGNPVPAAIAPLWCCGAGFGPGYNGQFKEEAVEVPAWAARTELWLILTGHGWGTDEENCAEFCPTEHEFRVAGGRPHVYGVEAAGSADGCGSAEAVERGVVPNQYGTWYFGRAGWCPGWLVPPYVADLSAEVKAGAAARLSYRGTFNGTDYVPVPAKEPAPGGFAPNINWLAWLVFYR